MAIAIALAVATGWLLLPFGASAASLQGYQSQEQQVNSALAQAQTQYRDAQAAWQVAHAHLIKAQGRIASVTADIAKLDRQATATQGQANVIANQVAATKADIATVQGRANSGLVLLQQHGVVAFVQVLLGSTSFADFLTRLDYLRRIWGSEIGLLRQAQVARTRLQTQQTELTAALARLNDDLAQANSQRQVLVQQRSHAEDLRRQEAADEARAASAIASLTKEKAGIVAAINALLAKLRAGHISWSQLQGLVDTLAARYHIDPLLVDAVIIAESGGDSRAVSSAGAKGLMQLMPGTAAGLGVTNPFDPVQNVRGGITYLLQMLQLFHGNLTLAIAAYNAGPGAVEKYGGIPPYAETQHYVQEVLGLYKSGK